jgi:Ca-activated chloride channel family protein
MMMSSGMPMGPNNPMGPNMTAPSALRGNRSNSITSAACGVLAALLAVVAVGANLAAQFTSGVQAVEVYASVVDKSGQPVRGLTRDDFELLEDGQPQTLTAFAAGDFPLTVALAVDHSFSMAQNRSRMLNGSKSAAKSFLSALRPADESLVVGIGTKAAVIAAADVPREQQIATVTGLSAWGTTPLHDAILTSIDAVDAAKGRRALVILSDGDDRYSTATADDVLARARQSNVMVYPIALGRNRPPLFAEIASVTGGRSFHESDPRRLDQVMLTVAELLREQYLLGYSPTRLPTAGTNEWRAITVRVKKPGVTVRARDGYYTR